MQKKSCVNPPICYTTTMKEKIKVGDMVIVCGQAVIVDEVYPNNPHRPFWGTTEDGEEVGFSTEQITAICP